MKRVMVLILAVVLAGCFSGKKSIKITTSGLQNQPVDSSGYELETFDQRFEVWYSLNVSQSTSRSKEFYEMWNRRYVAEWNVLAMSPGNNHFMEPIIGYEPNVDYGFELNRKLFYYFMYAENVLKIPVLNGKGPQSVVYFPE